MKNREQQQNQSRKQKCTFGMHDLRVDLKIYFQALQMVWNGKRTNILNDWFTSKPYGTINILR